MNKVAIKKRWSEFRERWRKKYRPDKNHVVVEHIAEQVIVSFDFGMYNTDDFIGITVLKCRDNDQQNVFDYVVSNKFLNVEELFHEWPVKHEPYKTPQEELRKLRWWQHKQRMREICRLMKRSGLSWKDARLMLKRYSHGRHDDLVDAFKLAIDTISKRTEERLLYGETN
jgi:hypothetical protein